MEPVKIFSIEIPVNNPEAMKEFQSTMDKIHDATVDYIHELAKELGITVDCASDVWYLRTRSRHTQELEDKLIQSHKNGKPLNVLAGEI